MKKIDKKINYKNISKAFLASWSKETSWTGKFDPKNPSADQCRVTAAVVQTLFGGKILFAVIKKRPLVSHFWNRLPNGKEIDFTLKQFPKSIIVPKGTVVSIKKVLSAPRIKKTYPLLLAKVKSFLKIK
ncbi:MAG: hypothetical protein WC348_02340 [Patescibacteria group bacterium]|jgi:hypothetical protein